MTDNLDNELYTFHLHRADGVSTAFEAHVLASDGLVLGRAIRILESHPTAAYVVVWAGERRVLTRPRIDAELRQTSSGGGSDADDGLPA